ncbi:hypothetical protein S7711_09963 [Stachybotrys chartarum IBT 7711]|uniref:Altered inheritance of mitochondria protein 24, mitochondrial n=1 Tax=Stachybotrys chartarum (strain CBS 109288 / IBT 7711) TaxID=1280523 RepID=A0A084AP41_STACB|nr:hypothetical protein S7711_09963 [Stachybotrys chartarum IBT 7711]KFA52564.1 hypothetical protein S40293_07622 [Stachybotrys chartarum IBT 40293]
MSYQQTQPQQQQQLSYAPRATSGPQAQQDAGAFQGGSFTIAHRDTNAILNLDLQEGATIRAIPGAMIHMSNSVQLAGKVKFSMKKLFTGGDLAESTYSGPGKIALAPTLFGDIIPLPMNGQQPWNVGKDAFLACTTEISKELKSQGLGKAFFSGEDLFIYRMGGQGIVWLTSFGAVDRLDLQSGEEHTVDNGHLVAWNCDFRIERAGGSSSTSFKTGEGLVCRFTGPGSVYVQTRNMSDFKSFIRANSAGAAAA